MEQKEDFSSAGSMSEERDDKPSIAVPTEPSEPEQTQQPSPKKSPSEKPKSQDYRQGFAFLALMILVFLVLSYFYVLLHGINVFKLLGQQQTELTFDFVGGNTNAFSISIEIMFWALMGVICQMAYQSTKTITKGEFDIWKSVFNWIGINLYAVGIAIAIIFSLNVISLNIGDIQITLANAKIEVIIAISFVLGFYSEESRRLLGRLRGQIVTGMEAESNKQKKSS